MLCALHVLTTGAGNWRIIIGMQPLISVIICTRDRASQLRRALQSLCMCTVPEGLDWEVLVVDNGSRDGSIEVTDEFQGRLPIRLTTEPTAGLSRARNRGIGEARGKWLVWIDDDVVVAADWLSAYYRSAQQYPEAAVFGGVIAPRLTGDAASWLREGINHVNDAYAARIATIVRGIIQPHTMPYGANFALECGAAKRYPFDIALGRHPQTPFRGGEELSVIRKILEEGNNGYWVPDAVVTHCIEPERQTEAYLIAYFSESGYTAAQKRSHDSTLSRTRSCLNSLLRWSLHRSEYAIHRADLTRARRARNIREAAWHLGFLKGCTHRLRWPRDTGASL